VRILHVSDVHVEEGFDDVPVGALFNKRLVGLANLWLRRRRQYGDARAKIAALAEAAAEWKVDLVIATGDFTALGTAKELAAAERALRPLLSRPLGAVCVPGNHDVYLHDGADLRFESLFADTLRDDLGRGTYPRVRLVDGDIAIVSFESARPNPEPWLSSGRVPDAQIDALRELGESGRLHGRRVIFATHYAPFLPDGRHDHARHGLENADALVAALAPFGEALFVHGHVHRRYHVRIPASSLTFFCAGSATMRGGEGFWLFDVHGQGVRAVPGGFRGGAPTLFDEAAVFLS
jgi:3',5'-cyclic AMP phosphodiesterase CpdA